MQGVGAAIVIPAEQALLVSIFTDSEAFSRAFGIWGAIGAAGGLFGILLGELLTQLAGWPWNFLINVPLGVVALLASSRVMPESRAVHVRRLDLTGALSATVAVLLIAYAPIARQQHGWSSGQALGSLGLAVVLLLIFLAVEARSSSPLVLLRIFRNRNANGANIASFLVGAAHAPVFLLLSLYFQQALHYDALTAGLAILPIAVLSLPVGILLVPRALDHLGARRVLAAGLFVLAAGAVLFSRAPIPNTFVVDILPGSVLMALGLPATFVGVDIAALTAVEQTDSGLASGLMNTVLGHTTSQRDMIEDRDLLRLAQAARSGAHREWGRTVLRTGTAERMTARCCGRFLPRRRGWHSATIVLRRLSRRTVAGRSIIVENGA